MLLLRVIQTSFLLFFIGSQRSLANPTSAAYSLESSPRKLKDDDAKEKDHHWDCQADSDYVQEQISLTTKLLSDGEKVTQQQKNLSTNGAVLVLGKAGSGKTSLVQFLTDNPKLQSKKIRSNTGEYTIEDGEKIGTSATESFTLYPELVNYNSSVTFCDSPGFHDSRSSAHEIVSMDFMKSVTSRFNKVKILLLENLGSLQYGVLKDSFIDTLHYLNDFLVDIDRYKDHIVLIATKIPLTHIITDDINVTSGIVTEEMHIESIMEYLNYTEKSLAKKLDGKIGKIKKDFYQKVIKLLQSLQTRDENGKATRINIFRRPYMSGPLKNMPLLEKNKELLTRTIMNLDFVEVKKNDFDFTLSNEAKMYLECLLKLTSDNYKNRINELSFKLSEVLAQKTQNYTSYHQVLEDLESFHNALKQLSENLDETKNYNEFFDRVNGFISDQKISPRINYNEQIHVLKKYEKILLKFVDTNLLFSPSSWTLSIRQVMKSAGEELHWYKSINKFIDGLASYKMQSNKTEVYSTIFHGHFISTNGLMNLFLDITGNGNLKQFIDAQTDSKRKLELVSIANTLLQQSNITCDPNGRLIIKGLHVRIAEINLEDLVKSHCNNISVKEIAILAVETVFLDEDTIDMFRGVNMFIAAPKWEVIGQRRIVLSGQPGSEISADNPYVENGKDGKPGLPGGNGGSFFGIGLQFVNGKSLCIESNGGRGGPGANGAKGERGPAGRNGSEKIKLGIYSNHSLFLKYGIRSDDINSAIIHQYDTSDDYGYYPPRRSPYVQHCSTRTKITVIIEDGDCGGIGALGGLGGESGIGGLPGNQQMIELGDSSQIEFQKKNGETGVRGTMGDSGDRGTDGTGMICVQHKDPDYYSEPCWKCESTNTTSSACNNSCLKQNETFKYQFTTTGIEQPAPLTSPDLTSYLLDHTNFLELYANQTIFKKVISDFRESIQRKFTYTLSDLVLV